MALKPDSDAYWQRVEHDLRVREPKKYMWSILSMRLGTVLILFTALYMVSLYVIEPPSGFFLTRMELSVHPIAWALLGVVMIVIGALIRYHAMGPLIERINQSVD
ncbi:MAG: hypothetical protein HQL36_00600 [Alphaproteobacteria bacterium]|nr:hypothetical protein [Alphaproteobacteria bacterium]MBF0249217.1 hypothetical protein [Alphaproteobacteria bacterium]